MRHWQDNAIYSVLSIVLFSLFSQMCVQTKTNS